MQLLLKLVPQNILKVHSTRIQVKRGHLRGLFFLIFAMASNEGNREMKVSRNSLLKFRFDYNFFIGLGGGGHFTAFLRCAAAF